MIDSELITLSQSNMQKTLTMSEQQCVSEMVRRAKFGETSSRRFVREFLERYALVLVIVVPYVIGLVICSLV